MENKNLIPEDFDCFSELEDLLGGSESARVELKKVIDSGIGVYLSKDLVEAFEWSDSPQGDHFWGGVKAMGLAGKKWKEGEERMNNIGRSNGNDGEHYEEVPKVDNVNSPEHYQSEDGIECIDAIRAALGKDGFVSHCRGTAIKYAWRSGKKANHAEDLRKAAWYLEKAASELDK